jgi:hypothetical protein
MVPLDVHQPHELREVVRQSGTHPRLARGHRSAERLGLLGERAVLVARLDPGR